MPLSNAYSRWRERLADRYALETTGKPGAFASAMTRLADQNLADADPEVATANVNDGDEVESASTY